MSQQLRILKPRKSLNKAFLKVKPNRTEIEGFKNNLALLLDCINESESEEFHKNLVSDFLKNTYYKQNHFINTKGRNDLVIHNSSNASSAVGVIIEAKKPTNRAEMLTKDTINVKAFHELVLYYLRERITQKNIEIKHLIATNINEWFIFDATLFDRLFAQNKNFVALFEDFEAGRLADTKTDFFYRQVAEPFIAEIKHDIELTYFDIRDYEKALRNASKDDDNQLIALFKLLAPEHLLKTPFANDSNSLDKRFYGELLHIIGLTETKDGGKRLIQRSKEGERNPGSLIENAIIQIDSLDKISRLHNPSQFGANQQERLFNVALELSITWINRILFLKLLEAQLLAYNRGDRSFEFLSIDKIKDYDDLNSLFFQVLARKQGERSETAGSAFSKVPYLNSSLFEPSEIEHSTIFISNLRNDKTIAIYPHTVLKDATGKKRVGGINPLEYLFEFLNAYDFASEGSEEIQESSKTLINASVLGLIFEKINGYRDGSFFTPGFITMYMCRETIRRAVVQKFNQAMPQAKGAAHATAPFKTLDDIYEQVGENRPFSRHDANEIINSLKICDPAVGSGHFLVSALNEIIAIKSDLKILQDRQGRRLKEYHLEVVNDELIVTDEDGELFEYTPTSKESQRVQEALFHEKQTIIERCLFGVDINPNSVKICRLRLWIELLKNAYYMVSPSGQALSVAELQTLPNIDINIKCGNSLISRFALDADLKQALKRSASKWTMDSYRLAVHTYRNANSKEQKREMERLINEIKNNFRSEISQNDPKAKRLRALSGELFAMTNQGQLFEMSEKEKKEWSAKMAKLTAEIKKLEAEIEQIKSNRIYENAFEWRFEFPEVLDENGEFVGFDVVIGNPPYYIMTKNNTDNLTLGHYLAYYQTIKNASSKNIFNLFIELGISIGNTHSYQTMIVPEGLFETRSYTDTISLFNNSGSVVNITRIEGMVFDEANTGNVIFIFGKNQSKIITRQQIFDKNRNLIDFEVVINPIINKIEAQHNYKLSEICYVFKGMVVSDRKKSIFETKHDNLPDKFILGNCISKWNINKNLYANYSELSIIGGTKSKAKHDYAPRILIRRTGDYLCCAYLTEPALTESTLYSCWSVTEDIHNLFILGVLHSKVADYYIKNKLVTNPQAFPQILMTDLQSLPIPKPTTDIHNSIKSLVELRLSSVDNDSNIESQIDQLVYQLYDLTDVEIAIVEDSLKQ